MRAVVQRVSSARVLVAGAVVGAVERGMVVFLGIGKEDSEADVDYLADKIAGLRIFEDDHGKMNHGLEEIGGGLLVVSQFTLYGDTRRGKRPSFDLAMGPKEAERLYDLFVARARRLVTRVETGRFRADMRVVVDNDGPVTLIVESG
jgi:D-tyrosyl-tRNA(Tyr) deacylase